GGGGLGGEACEGSEGVAPAGWLHPYLVLMDRRMPGMGGIDAIRAIRADDPAVPIGVLTMFETRDFVDAALAAGASGYVAKDATPAEFCQAASLLDERKRRVRAIPRGPAAAAAGSGAGAVLRR